MNFLLGIAGLIVRFTALAKAINLLRYSKNYRVILLILLLIAFVVSPIVNPGLSLATWSNIPLNHVLTYFGTSLLALACAHFLGYYIKRYTKNSKDFEKRLSVFDEFISASPVLYFIVANDKIVYCNPATVIVSGYSEEELFKGAYNQIFYEEDRDLLERILEETNEDITTTQRTIRIQNKQGDIRWLHATFTTLSYNSRPAIAASAQDITQQIKTETILQNAEERLRFAVESTELVVWDCDPIGDRIRLESVPSTFPIKDYSDFFSFNSFLKYVDPRDKHKALSTLSKIKNKNTRFEIEFRVRVPGKESEWWYMEGRSYAETKNLPARITGTSRCIQAQKKAREVIEKNEALIRFQADLLANIGQMILAQNKEGHVVYWNSEAKKLFGELANSPLPFNPEGQIPNRYRIINNKEIMGRLKMGKQWSGEREAYLITGETVPLHLNVSPYTNKAEEFDGFIIVGTDLTEHKKIQSELKASQEQLQVQMHRLQAIYTMAEVMKEADNLSTIYKAAADGISLVSDIDRVAILILTDEKLLTFAYSQNLPAYYQNILLEHCTWVNDTQPKQDIYIPDVQTASTCNKLSQSFADEGISSMAAFPLSHQNEILGKVIAFWDDPVELLPVKTQILRRIADQLAIAIVKKKAEIQLKHRTDELQIIADNIPDHIVRLDNDFNLLFANKATYDHPIHEETDLTGLEQFFSSKRMSSIWKKKLASAFKNGRMQEFEFAAEDENKGSPRYFQATVVPEKSQQDTQNPSTQSVIGIIRDITENRELQKLIVDLNARQQRKIGQDLHDELGQLLTGIGFLVAGLKKDLEYQNTPHDDLSTINELVEKAIAQTRILAEGLNPVTLELHGLTTSLQRLSLHTEKLYNIPCSFRCDTSLDSLNDETAYQVYRIAQEAITNSVKHAHPSLISVSLHQSKGNIVLQITDDGIGIQPDKQRQGGQGMQIMQYRTRMIHGDLTVESRPKQGTCVSCIFPQEKVLQD